MVAPPRGNIRVRRPSTTGVRTRPIVLLRRCAQAVRCEATAPTAATTTAAAAVVVVGSSAKQSARILRAVPGVESGIRVGPTERTILLNRKSPPPVYALQERPRASCAPWYANIADTSVKIARLVPATCVGYAQQGLLSRITRGPSMINSKVTTCTTRRFVFAQTTSKPPHFRSEVVNLTLALGQLGRRIS